MLLCALLQAQVIAAHVAKEASELDVVAGRVPVTIAAASIYFTTIVMGIEKSASGKCSFSSPTTPCNCNSTVSILLTKITAPQNYVALSYHSVRGLYFIQL